MWAWLVAVVQFLRLRSPSIDATWELSAANCIFYFFFYKSSLPEGREMGRLKVRLEQGDPSPPRLAMVEREIGLPIPLFCFFPHNFHYGEI